MDSKVQIVATLSVSPSTQILVGTSTRFVQTLVLVTHTMLYSGLIVVRQAYPNTRIF